jgi:uncharacterized protein YcbX
MAVVGTVVQLWRYPVKSMAGERLEHTRFDGQIAGDRAWGVFDAVTGKLLSAKSVGALLGGRARWEATGETSIDLPGGVTVIAGTAAADREIGSWLGRAVELRRAGAGERATIDMELDDGDDTGPRGMDSITTQPGLLFDSRSTLHLIGEATLAQFDRDHALGAGDVRRFRPNLVVAGCAASGEDAWVDGEIRIGDVIAHVRKRTERCVIVSRAQPGMNVDRHLLRHLKVQHDMRVGVYLDARTVGEITVGAAVEALDGR